MSSFTRPLTVTKISARKWKVEREFSYYIWDKTDKDRIVVPKGFITDFASVPRPFWFIFPPDGLYTQAAVLHDFLYFSQPYIRIEVDIIFLQAMKALKVSWWRRVTIYRAVRLFAWIPWNRHARKLKAS